MSSSSTKQETPSSPTFWLNTERTWNQQSSELLLTQDDMGSSKGEDLWDIPWDRLSPQNATEVSDVENFWDVSWNELLYLPIWTVEKIVKFSDGTLAHELKLRPVVCRFHQALTLNLSEALKFFYNYREEKIRKVNPSTRLPIYDIDSIPGQRICKFLDQVYWGKELMVVMEVRTVLYWFSHI
ncbi:hypothetical protein M406DRAFT_71398 [Cryphonectria parasitica EP155]|uniref:Uncharacterized protein n=1 Tax=Cryphonectria parasitica (strain ATCC 38755 / EP155) TaxID=660469 RepID=A0A9P4Y955_CRYP1|nr:uncharacterized protein M406DRAFT_71398 [Cryphonectria parasitica EP155]KAF3768345.1 hypothetical protein M406DRAFT_71398 [Cryphonectria parasitica EP155]